MRNLRPQHVHFLPWRGKNYAKSACRLLILGESHYSEAQEGPLFTRRLTREYVTGKFNHRFWTQIGQVITGKPRWEIDRKTLWDGIAFYNYIQRIEVNAAGCAPPNSAFHRSERAFWEVLDILKPTHLIALGNRLWIQMPALENENLKMTLGGQSRQYGYYRRSWGKTAATSINHPSWGFSKSYWHPIVRDFLAIDHPASV